MSSVDYTSSAWSQVDFTATDENTGNGLQTIVGDEPGPNEPGYLSWQMKQDGSDWTTLIYSYDSTNNVGVWAHPLGNLVSSYNASTGVVTMSSDPTNPNGPTPEFSFVEANAFQSSGSTYSGTVTRHTRSVTFPLSNDFVYRTPDLSAGRLEYEKYDNYKFRVSWFDQNEPAAGYNATLKWYSSGGQVSISQQITADSGDITWQVDTNTPGWPIDHDSDITLHFDVNVVVSGGSAITAGDAIKTFTYLGWGPFTGTFTKQKFRPGDTISWEIRDTNPYPDYTGYMVSLEQEDGTSTDFQLLSTNAIPYGVAGSFATADDSEGVARLWEADIAHRTAPRHILAECVVKKFGKVFSNFW